MPMTLYFKRAKCFVQPGDNDSGTKKFLAQAGPSPVPVPFWVAETATFKQGIKDESIINLTPPHLMPGYKHPVEEPECEQPADPSLPGDPEAVDKPEPDEEQKDIPQAPFGGQPMTPVPPAAKLGNVRAGRGK